MPTIKTLTSPPIEFEVEIGKNLMEALQEKGLPVASSCHGDGVCGKCRVSISAVNLGPASVSASGAEVVSPVTELEMLSAESGQLGSNQRLSCQCKVLGDLEVGTGYW